MATGRVVVMYDLPGVPPDYAPYFIRADADSTTGLADAMARAASITYAEFSKMGGDARHFVMKCETAVAQTEKISMMLVGHVAADGTPEHAR